METAIGILRVLFWLTAFLALIGGVLFAVYTFGFMAGVDDEQKRKRRDGSLERAMERVRELAEKDPDMWDTEIDA